MKKLTVAIGKKLLAYSLGFLANLFKLRFGLINQVALGHLAFDTEVNFLESNENRKMGKHFWYLVGTPTNQILSNYWKKKVGANKNPIRLRMYSALQPFPRFHHLLLNREIGAGDGAILDEWPSTFAFTVSQSKRANYLRNRLNINFAKPLVLFCLRDDAYYRHRGDILNMSIHSHRNVDPNRYTAAIEFFLSKGCTVVRMGRLTDFEFVIKDKDFIDLPNNQEFSVQQIGLQDREILELVLFQECKFVISTGLGLDALGTLFRKRIYLADMYSICNLYATKLFPLVLPKGYLNSKENSILNFGDVLGGFFVASKTAKEFESAGISLVDCSEDQILKFATDVYNLEFLEIQPKSSKASDAHQEFFSSRFNVSGDSVPRISEHWLNCGE